MLDKLEILEPMNELSRVLKYSLDNLTSIFIWLFVSLGRGLSMTFGKESHLIVLCLCIHLKCWSSDNQVLVHCSSTEHILIHCSRDEQILVACSKFCYMIFPLYSSSPIPADICIWCSCVLRENYICKECIIIILYSILQHEVFLCVYWCVVYSSLGSICKQTIDIW